jgi:hypothetical protein
VGDAGDATATGFCESAWYDMGLSIDDMPLIIEQVEAEGKRSETLAALSQ